MSLPSILAFWQAVINRGYILSDKITGKPTYTEYEKTAQEYWPGVVWKYEIYNEFQDWCNKGKEKYIPAERQFWRKTWTFWPNGCPKRILIGGAGNQKGIVVLPDIEELQKCFTKLTKIDFVKFDQETDQYYDATFNFGTNTD